MRIRRRNRRSPPGRLSWWPLVPLREPHLSSSFWLCSAEDKRELDLKTLSTMGICIWYSNPQESKKKALVPEKPSSLRFQD